MFKHFEAFQKSLGIDPDEHLGNMWGWKVSYWGLGIIVFLIALYYYRVTFHPLPVDDKTTVTTEEVIKQD